MYERGIRRRRTWLLWLFFHHPQMPNRSEISTIARYVGPIRIHDSEYFLIRHLLEHAEHEVRDVRLINVDTSAYQRHAS